MKFWFERGAWASKHARRMIANMDPLAIRRVAVIRHAALGDMVLVRPFLVELKKFFPNARIVLSLVSNYTYGAPEDLADEIHVLHGSDQRGVNVQDRIRQARALGPVDILFDLADTTRSRYLCALTQAGLKVGFPYRGYLRPLLYDAAVWRSDFSFEAINMLDMLMLLGANPMMPPEFAWIPTAVTSRADTPYLVYFPFASVDSKCWPKERFVDLIKSLSSRLTTHTHVVLSGVGAAESAMQFNASLGGCPNVRLQDALPLTELTDFLRGAAVVVSNDTGVRNLAIATETPTVGIFFSTVPYRYWPRYGHHQAVFRASGELPTPSEVGEVVLKLLESVA